MDFSSWLFEQAKIASPFVAVFSLVACVVAVRMMWLQHIRDIADMKSNARAQIRAQIADARATAKLARAIGELTAKIKSGR